MVWIFISFIVFLIDLYIKKWAEKNLKDKGRKPIGKTGCSLVLIHNKGFAGSRMKEKPELVKWIHGGVLVIMALFCVLAGYFKKGNEMTALGLSFVFGGGASNLYDRFKKGYVTDYLGLPVAKKLVFNLSDLCIFAGALLALLGDLKK